MDVDLLPVSSDLGAVALLRDGGRRRRPLGRSEPLPSGCPCWLSCYWVCRDEGDLRALGHCCGQEQRLETPAWPSSPHRRLRPGASRCRSGGAWGHPCWWPGPARGVGGRKQTPGGGACRTRSPRALTAPSSRASSGAARSRPPRGPLRPQWLRTHLNRFLPLPLWHSDGGGGADGIRPARARARAVPCDRLSSQCRSPATRPQPSRGAAGAARPGPSPPRFGALAASFPGDCAEGDGDAAGRPPGAAAPTV